MKERKDPKLWRRPVANVSNLALRPNSIYEAFSLGREITDDDQSLELYFTNRVSAPRHWDSTNLNSLTQKQNDDYVERILYQSLVSNKDLMEGRLLDSSNRFLAITGRVGAGKTTLIQHFVRIYFPRLKSFSKNAMTMHAVILNGLGFEHFSVYTKEKIAKEILKSLRESHSELFSIDKIREIAIKGGGAKGDLIRAQSLNKTEMVERILKLYEQNDLLFLSDISHYINEIEKSLFLVIVDNIDQLPLERQKQLLDSFWGILHGELKFAYGIINLREYTLAEHREFSESRHLNVLEIGELSIGDLIEKRMKKAVDILRRQKEPLYSLSLSEDIHIGIASYEEFFNKWAKTFRNPEIENFLKNMCNGNMRMAFNVVEHILKSGHMNVPRIVSKFYESKSYSDSHYGLPYREMIDLQEVYTLLMLGDNLYFKTNPENLSSTMAVPARYNIFNNRLDPNETKNFRRVCTLIQLRLLVSLKQANSLGIEISELFNFANCLDFQPEEIVEILQILCDHSIAESREGRKILNAKKIYITDFGRYFLGDYYTRIEYLGFMIGDTYINYDEDPLSITSSEKERIAKVLRFVEFVLNEEKREQINIDAHANRDRSLYLKLTEVETPISWQLLTAIIHQLHRLVVLNRFTKLNEFQPQIKKLFNRIISNAEEKKIAGVIAPEQIEGVLEFI